MAGLGTELLLYLSLLDGFFTASFGSFPHGSFSYGLAAFIFTTLSALLVMQWVAGLVDW